MSLVEKVLDFFRPAPPIDLDSFLAKRSGTAQESVEYWKAEYSRRKRIADKLRSRGQEWAARQIMLD